MNFDKIEQDAVVAAMIKAKPKMDLIRTLTQLGAEHVDGIFTLDGSISDKEVQAAIDQDLPGAPNSGNWNQTDQFLDGLTAELNTAIWEICKKRIDALQKSIQADITLPAVEGAAHG